MVRKLAELSEADVLGGRAANDDWASLETAAPPRPTYPRPLFNCIRSAVERFDWITARGAFDQYQELTARDTLRAFLIAGAAQDWMAALKAEDEYRLESGKAGLVQLPKAAARIAFQARLELELVDDALALARARCEAFPNQHEWMRREAQAVARLGDYDAALAIGAKAWSQGRDFGALIVAQSLAALGKLEECGEFLRELESADQTANLIRARLAYWVASPEHDQALAEVLAVKEKIPGPEYYRALARHASRARDQDVLDGLLGQVVEWSAAGDFDTLFCQAAPAVLSHHFHCLFNWPTIAPLVELLSRRALMPNHALMASKLAVRAGEYRLADRIVRRARGLFPSALHLWRQHLSVLTLLGDFDERSMVRERMKAQFRPESFLAAMSVAEPRSWDMRDLPHLLAFNLETGNNERQAKFFASLGEAPLSEDQVDLLADVSANGPPVVAAQIDLMLAPLRDRRLLADAAMTPAEPHAFDQTLKKTRDGVRRITRYCSTGEGGGAAGYYGMSECLRLIASLQKKRCPARIFTRESYADAAVLVRALVERIDRKQATSVLRIGDGDAHFLTGHPSTLAHRDIDRAAIQEIWWGTTRMDGARLNAIESHFERAVHNSTVLAVIPPWRFLAEMARPKYTFAHRGILNGVAYCASMKYRGDLITSMHFPNDLHKWDLWPEIFAAVPSVSYISCHDMRAFLWESFAMQTRQAIHIPGEHQYSALFEEGGGEPAPTETLLDRHEDLCAAIDPAPGEVFLVAAGFLGKIYCEIVRERGGVAIDIGSLADYWMGFATRRYRLEQYADVGLPNKLIGEGILPLRKEAGRMTGHAAVARSSADCRYNVASVADVEAAAGAPREQRLLRVVGHPRCASAYMATLFMEMGLEIGHEKLLRDGISNWMSVADDHHVPYGDTTHGVDFAHTVAHVRDPADAIPSIMMENGRAVSFNYRRLHILRACGVDLADWRSALDRAVASLVFWYDMVEALNPEATFKVEDAEGPVRDYVARAGILATAHGAQDAPVAVAREAEADPEPDEARKVNNSMGKFGRDKPEVAQGAYAGLDPDLQTRLETYCARYDYPAPWAARAG
ncbi:MAG: hypothetical protein ABI306_08955 [Caulobacteraceae bacterium]